MTLKRYGSVLFDTGLIEMACGDYVTYSDYQKLVTENAALKKCAKIDDYDKCDNCGYESYVMPIETPATDAAIAEICAKAVDEFSEYIVSSNRTVENLYCEMQAMSFAANLRAGRKG